MPRFRRPALCDAPSREPFARPSRGRQPRPTSLSTARGPTTRKHARLRDPFISPTVRSELRNARDEAASDARSASQGCGRTSRAGVASAAFDRVMRSWPLTSLRAIATDGRDLGARGRDRTEGRAEDRGHSHRPVASRLIRREARSRSKTAFEGDGTGMWRRHAQLGEDQADGAGGGRVDTRSFSVVAFRSCGRSQDRVVRVVRGQEPQIIEAPHPSRLCEYACVCVCVCVCDSDLRLRLRFAFFSSRDTVLRVPSAELELATPLRALFHSLPPRSLRSFARAFRESTPRPRPANPGTRSPTSHHLLEFLVS